MEIIYCSKCGKQIPPGGLEDGRYYLLTGEPVCPDCYEALPAEEHTGATLAHPHKVETRKLEMSPLVPATARRRRTSAARMEPVARPKGSGKVFGVAAGVLAGAAVVLGIVLWAASPPARPPGRNEKPPAVPVKPPIGTAKPPAAKLDLERGLVAWWKLDGADATWAADSSGKDNAGKLNGGPMRVAGRLGRALQLDGVNDYVDVAASKSLDVSGAMTFAAWVKPAASDFEWQCLMEYNDGEAFGAHFYLAGDVRDANRRALFANLVDADGNPHSGYTEAGTWKAGEWQHVAVTRDGSTVSFYLNGEKRRATLETGLGADTRLKTAGAFRIGARTSIKKTYFLKGLIDDVRVYNRALGADEVAKLALRK